MISSIFNLQFGRPLFLLFFALLPLLWLRWRDRSLSVILWRSSIVALLVLSLAELGQQRVEVSEKSAERFFAFDLSRSIPPSMRKWMGQQELDPAPGDRAFIFGGEVQEVEDWREWVTNGASAQPVKPAETNLEALFEKILQEPKRSRDLFLFTDGWETAGSVERLVPSLAASGLRVFPVLPSVRPEIANVAVKRILAPPQGTSGEGIRLTVLLENYNSREVQGDLTLARNNQTIKSERLSIAPGTRLFSFEATLGLEPLASFQVSFTPREPRSDLFPEDNRATAWVGTRAKAKVLLINARAGEGKYLEEILKRRGFEVTSVEAVRSPPSLQGYGLVIFNNVERERFPTAFLAQVERHVAAGNGFLMLGGERSFGPGGYRETPVEAVLPVELKEPKKEEKRRAVILVIDKSGSMREENRFLYAREAAKSVVAQLKERDLLGVVAFDVAPFVVMPLSPVTAARETLPSQIDRLRPSGKTYLYPALIEAKRQLERQEAENKHVIILSDGETGGSGGDYVDLVSVMKRELGMTVSAVAIGREANIPLLKRIAQYGGGLFHHTFDATNVPQIVLEQIREKPEPADGGPLREREVRPLPVRNSELLAGFPERVYPILKGYIETELKRDARLDLLLPAPEKNFPLLASWNYGKGKAVAFTTDLSARWSTEWIRWDSLERFWGKVFDWLSPSSQPLPPYEARINLMGNRPVLDLFVYGAENDGSLFRFSVNGPKVREEGVLRRLAPGHYQTGLPFSSPGDYRMELSEERRGQRILYPPLGYTLAFHPRSEIPRGDFNLPLLEQLARATGGEVNPAIQERQKSQERVQTMTPLRPYLVFLAMTFFLLEILFRRFVLRTAG